MTALDPEVLAEKAAAVERHLRRVAERLPAKLEDFKAGTDASDAVVLHLWQATQIAIDLALSLCVRLKLGTPSSYADAFSRLEQAGRLTPQLAGRLRRASGFRNTIAHAYEQLDMARVFRAAQEGPKDLRAFLAVVRDVLAAP